MVDLVDLLLFVVVDGCGGWWTVAVDGGWLWMIVVVMVDGCGGVYSVPYSVPMLQQRGKRLLVLVSCCLLCWDHSWHLEPRCLLWP